MKWRVKPDERVVNAANSAVDYIPNIVEADVLDVHDGCLVFDAHEPVFRVVKAYAPGQWTTVERVGDEND